MIGIFWSRMSDEKRRTNQEIVRLEGKGKVRRDDEMEKKGKSFEEKCYYFLKKVTKGKVTTYKELGKVINSKAYRAVGNAMNKNPYPGSSKGQVPCHRVVRNNGEVGGFAFGTKNKIKILKSEGIEINNGRINLKKYLYKF